MYVTFVRPLLEYASVVCDGCSILDTDKLEKVQLYAERIETGLPILASKESLYFETGNRTIVRKKKKSQIENNHVQNAYKHSTSIPM